LVDGVGDQPVRLAVHGVGRLGVRRLDEAEDLALALVDPVPQVADVVVGLLLQVGGVRVRDVAERDPTVEVVDVHEQWHVVLLFGVVVRCRRR
jgi:hypothetical protein